MGPLILMLLKGFGLCVTTTLSSFLVGMGFG
jgi:hypothetical protein